METQGISDNINESNLTPAVLQYLKIKKKHNDCLVLFRMGDFYEAFFDDAKTLAQDLNIVLTSKGKGEKKVPLAGIPYHSVYNYLKKLIEKGRKIAICEQLEDAKFAKGLIKRDVVRIITPGTLIEENLLSTSNNYLLSVSKPDKTKAISYGMADISTGELFFFSNYALDEILDKFLPSEVILDNNDISILESLKKRGLFYTVVENAELNSAKGFLKEFFEVSDLSCFGISDNEIIPIANLIKYIAENLKLSKSHFCTVKRINFDEYLEIDSNTATNLELVKSMRDGSENNTLFSVLNYTSTVMGKRLLKFWLTKPLRKIDKINNRLDLVEKFYFNSKLLSYIHDQLKEISDIERVLTRIKLRNTSKKDLLSLRNSLEHSLEIVNSLKADSYEVFERIFVKNPEFLTQETMLSVENYLSNILSLMNELSLAIDDTFDESILIKQGYSKELDELKSLRSNLNSWLLDYEERERKRTGIKSLKVKYNSVFGFFIEVSKANLDKVPRDYIRKQTQVSSERFITDELHKKEIEILNLDERIANLEKELFEQVLKKIDESYNNLFYLSRAISYLDCIHSLAMVAQRNDYVKPIMHESFDLEIKELRHPVMEKVLTYFIPNDILMNEKERLLVITGPNMAGKSTIMRMTALAIVMAHLGSFVPAKKAKIPIVDKIFSRIGARDDIVSGQSTFMLEMLETAFILNNATERSFIILDEIGRGTSTYDGISLAYAIAEYIAKHIKAKTMFATHYHQLNELELNLDNVVNYYVEVKEENQKIIFTYRFLRGKIDKSYGIHVAKLAGLPDNVIKKAEFLMEMFELQEKKKAISSNLINQEEKSLVRENMNQIKQNKLSNYFEN
ncbi:MAG: DNA mismatch repair protein MutS [Candidatus Micrarchaeota archaeon]|nr:DNA mismatch repair protein MutS [Candidatus Micrarchaeota archaeon]